MNLVYAVSQKADTKHPAARHLDGGNGRLMCGGNGREPLVWAAEEGEPTCKICIDLALMVHGESDQL